MRILYVEDNMANVSLVRRIAGKDEVINYIDGEEALRNFKSDDPDLVLMDIQLAGRLTGLDVVKQLRQDGHKLPIIAVTAYAMVGDRERCLDAGCDDYIAKPLPIPRLVELFAERRELISKAPAAPAEPEQPVAETPTPPEAAPIEPTPPKKSTHTVIAVVDEDGTVTGTQEVAQIQPAPQVAATESPSTETAKPEAATESPSTETAKAEAATESPSAETAKAEAATESPSTETAKAEAATESPSTEMAKPEAATESPSTEMAKPEAATESPSTETAKAEAATESPSTETAKAEAATEATSTETAKAEAATESPSTETAKPETAKNTPKPQADAHHGVDKNKLKPKEDNAPETT